MGSACSSNDFIAGQRVRLGLDHRHAERGRRSRCRQIGPQSGRQVSQLSSVLIVLAGVRDGFEHSDDLAQQLEPGRSVSGHHRRGPASPAPASPGRMPDTGREDRRWTWGSPVRGQRHTKSRTSVGRGREAVCGPIRGRSILFPGSGDAQLKVNLSQGTPLSRREYRAPWRREYRAPWRDGPLRLTSTGRFRERAHRGDRPAPGMRPGPSADRGW